MPATRPADYVRFLAGAQWGAGLHVCTSCCAVPTRFTVVDVVDRDVDAALARSFLAARFDGGERYVRRLEKIEAMEREFTYG